MDKIIVINTDVECMSPFIRVMVNEEYINAPIIELKKGKHNLIKYVNRIANKLDKRIAETIDFLNTLNKVSVIASFSLILKEVAITLDEKYDDHIENSPEIYSISTTNGKIVKVNKATIKNYRNFAAFRTIEDAKVACNITRDLLKALFNSGK